MKTNIQDYNWLSRAKTIKTIVKPYHEPAIELINNDYSLKKMESLISNIEKNDLRIRPREIYLRGDVKIDDAYSVLNDSGSLIWYNFFGEQSIKFSIPMSIEIEYLTYYPAENIPYLKRLAELYQGQQKSALVADKPQLVQEVFNQFCVNHKQFIQQAENSRSLEK